jgi:hypothetical protein
MKVPGIAGWYVACVTVLGIMPRPERIYSDGYIASVVFALVMLLLARAWHPFR